MREPGAFSIAPAGRCMGGEVFDGGLAARCAVADAGVFGEGDANAEFGHAEVVCPVGSVAR